MANVNYIQFISIVMTNEKNIDLKDLITEIKTDIIHLNIHGATYNRGSQQVATQIGGWSEGCLVLNNNPDYEKMVKMAKDYSAVSICLINEF